jgi:Flp pilus assembly protein TadD
VRVRRVRASVLSALFLCGCGGAPVRAPAAARVRDEPAPSSPGAVDTMMRGVQASKDGQCDRAVALLRDAVRIDGHLWEARYDLGIVLAEAGDLKGAEAELAIAAQFSRDVQDVAIGLAEVRRRRGEYELAAAGLADFVRGHPGAVGARTLYVEALRESGQLDQAIVEAREVLVRQPGDSTALAELSLLRLARGEKEAAALLAKQALDASPNSAVAHRATGLIDLANGDDAMAFGEFRKAAQADPHDTTSRLNMGVVLLRAGAYSKAEEQYRDILSVDPDHTEAQVGLAAALRGEAGPQHPKKLEEARSLLEGVLAKDPHQTSALFNLGVLSADFLKDPSGAAPLFERFLADTPSDEPRRAQAEKYLSAAKAVAQAVAPAVDKKN